MIFQKTPSSESNTPSFFAQEEDKCTTPLATPTTPFRVIPPPAASVQKDKDEDSVKSEVRKDSQKAKPKKGLLIIDSILIWELHNSKDEKTLFKAYYTDFYNITCNSLTLRLKLLLSNLDKSSLFFNIITPL